jgi:hypothetical protein
MNSANGEKKVNGVSNSKGIIQLGGKKTCLAQSSKIGKHCCEILASWNSLKALSPAQL